MTSNIIRDTALGSTIRYITRNRVLQYPEERSGFQLPNAYTKAIQYQQRRRHSDGTASRPLSLISDKSQDGSRSQEKTKQDLEDPAAFAEEDQLSVAVLDDGTIVVSWYNNFDPENPQNWTSSRKNVAVGLILIYTFAIYLGSSICTSSYTGVMKDFNVSQQAVSLTLSMYVLAYGLGPLLWSPLSEIPSVGRTWPYIITFGLFVILNVPTALADNFAGLVVLRFLCGFFGGTSLATGPASIGDVYSFAKLPYGISLWAFAATCAPATAPLISGFAVPAESWRWSFWELLWLSGPVWLALYAFLPETSAANILLRRAERLRKATGNINLKSQSEIDQSHMNANEIAMEALWRPFQLMLLDPSIAFTALYSALIYGFFYSFFEAFPIVYQGMHNFSLGQQGIVFLSINIGATIAIALYWAYNYFHLEPQLAASKPIPLEHRLVPALPASFLMPIGMFIFAWTSSPEIHWIAPTIGVSVFLTGIFVVLQCIFIYLPLSYTQYTASLFAGNDIARSVMAAATIHFSVPLYERLGVAKGVTIMACLMAVCILGVFGLWRYGGKLRAGSRFAA